MASSPPMRVLVEPTELLNLGDLAMLEVGLERLRARWPNADFSYFSDGEDAAVARLGMTALPARGRTLWFDEPFLEFGPWAHLPVRWRRSREQWEDILRSRRPRLALRLITFRLRMRGRADDEAEVHAFFNAVRDTNLAFVCGMGGITDVFRDYARELLGTLDLAMAFGARTVLVGQGLGPLQDAGLRAQAARVLARADFIGLREARRSEPLLLQLRVATGKFMVTGDDAIELAYSRRPAVAGPGIGINLRLAPYSRLDAQVLERARDLLECFVHSTGAPVVPLPVSHAPDDDDAASIRLLLSRLDPHSSGGGEIDSAMALIEQVKRCRLVLTGSYHAAVFALSMGVPAVCLARSEYYDDKFRGLADQFGGGCDVVAVSDGDWPERLQTALEQGWMDGASARPQLLSAAARQVSLSHSAWDRIEQIIGRDQDAR